jgi:hypothetical protein
MKRHNYNFFDVIFFIKNKDMKGVVQADKWRALT